MRSLLAVALAALAFGCGGSSKNDASTTTLTGAPVDCVWLASDNCWKTTVAAAQSCLPPASSAGQLSADGTTCTYASGTTVTFDVPLVLPLDDTKIPPEWKFELKNGADTCLTYDWRENVSQTLTVDGMTYNDTAVGFGVQTTCPDGSKYSVANEFELLGCNDIPPGFMDPHSASSVTFELNGANDQPVTVFTCAR